MAFSRYARAPLLNFGTLYGTSRAREAIQAAVANGQLTIQQVIVTRGGDRLDTIAGVAYGDGRYWWVLAAASNIGWGMQIPPGTMVYVPNLATVAGLIG